MTLVSVTIISVFFFLRPSKCCITTIIESPESRFSVILGDANGIMATIGDNVNSFQSLSFSREFEHQADADGFKILIANKVNPQGMSNLFKRLQQHHSISIPEFLSSHPVTENRIDFINKMIKNQKNQKVTNPQLEKLFAKLKQ